MQGRYGLQECVRPEPQKIIVKSCSGGSGAKDRPAAGSRRIGDIESVSDLKTVFKEGGFSSQALIVFILYCRKERKMGSFPAGASQPTYITR